jgi:hypothetical protein
MDRDVAEVGADGRAQRAGQAVRQPGTAATQRSSAEATSVVAWVPPSGSLDAAARRIRAPVISPGTAQPALL